MSIRHHLDKNNLHHAYLIEGTKEEIVPEIFAFLEDLGLETKGNADVLHLNLDSFKIDDARSLKSFASERANSLGKKVFIVSTNNLLLEAQNSMLKMFEEPIENTHFFLVTPDTSALLKTFTSRFYHILSKQDLKNKTEDAKKFIAMSPQKRIDFIKELLVEAEEEDEEGNEIIAINSARSKAIKFLNELESTLHHKVFIEGKDKNPHQNPHAMIPFRQIFKVRQFLRQPGSSTKTLLESVALVVPNFRD